MEEKMIMMMRTTTSSSNNTPETTTNEEATTTSAFPSWKLYDNPSYNSRKQNRSADQKKQTQCQSQTSTINKSQHCLRFPVSARKLAASFWDLTFSSKPAMQTETDHATRSHVMQLKAELELERKARKVEGINKKLSKELNEERRAREAMESVCEELAREISTQNSEIKKMKKEMEEERKMLRVAEVIREERFQMKLSEAMFLLEEKVSQLSCKPVETEKSTSFCVENDDQVCSNVVNKTNSKRENSSGLATMTMIPRRAKPESENPHIKRGISGFVEFPRVVRAIGTRSRHWGTMLECQKAQLRILLKQKNPIRSNSLIIS